MRKKVLAKQLIEILNRRIITMQDQKRKTLTFEISLGTVKKDYGTSHSPSLDSKKEMNHNLEMANCDLQCAMFRASQSLKRDELLRGASDDFIKGFWSACNYLQEGYQGINEICDETLGKIERRD